MLGHVLKNVRGSRVDEIVLVLGHAAETIKEQVATNNLKVVINEDYRARNGDLTAGWDSPLCIPKLTPHLSFWRTSHSFAPATLDRLIDQYQKSNAQIAIPIYKGFRGNPVLLDRSVFSEVMALRGDTGCRAIFGNHLEGIVKVPVEDVGILLDLDSKDDFEKLQRFRSRHSG